MSVYSKFIQPSIEILNLRIDEPITTITDILLGIICIYAFFRMGRLKVAGNGFTYFRRYFLVLGLGAITGGLLGHAFQYCLANSWKLVSWNLTLVSVALMVQGVLVIAATYLKKGIVAMITMLNLAGPVLTVIITSRSNDFSGPDGRGGDRVFICHYIQPSMGAEPVVQSPGCQSYHPVLQCLFCV